MSRGTLKTRAELLLEQARLHRRLADNAIALAALETTDAPANAPSSPATVAEIVDLAIEHAEVRATRRAG